MKSPVIESPDPGVSPARAPIAADSPRSLVWCCLTFAALAAAIIVAAAIRWSLGHPFGMHWDESSYLNEAFGDVQRLRHGMVLKWGGRVLVKSWGRPPAYRLIADPFLAIVGATATRARLVSLACYLGSAVFVYRSTRLLADRAAGALAVLIFCLASEVVAASMFFGTDAPVYLATAGMLFYLLRSWNDPTGQRRNWIGLGLALGLGFLAKTTFLLIGVPALAFWAWVSWRRSELRSGAQGWWRTAVLVLLIAAPWWALNGRGAFAYAMYAKGTSDNSLGPASVAKSILWAETIVRSLLGEGVALVAGFILLLGILRVARSRKLGLSSLQRSALGLCLCAGLPLVAAQFASTNDLLRYITPSVIPLAIVVGMIAHQVGWLQMRVTAATLGLLLAGQLWVLIKPVLFPNTQAVPFHFANGELPSRVMTRVDQWNWEPLRQISYDCGVPRPRIGFLGAGREYNPPAIEYPWVAAALPTRLSTFDFPDVTWLWRREYGPIDWTKTMSAAAQEDLVLVTPHYTGDPVLREDLDNQNDERFAALLKADPRFQKPVIMHAGRFTSVEIDVFPRRGLVCRMR